MRLLQLTIWPAALVQILFDKSGGSEYAGDVSYADVSARATQTMNSLPDLVGEAVFVYAGSMSKPFDNPALYPATDPIEHRDAFMSLRPEEKAFVSAYLASLSSSAASAGKAVADMLNVEVDNSDRARQFLARPRVRLAIIQRARHLSAKFEITANSLLKEIAHIAFSNIANFMHMDENGLPYYDFRNVTFEQMSAIKAITIEEETEGRGEKRTGVRKVKVEMHNKQTSHDQLMKYLSLYSPERHEVNVNVKSESLTVNMTPEQLADIWHQRLKQVN